MALTPYRKPHAAPADWVRHLSERGLIVANPQVAADEIDLIGYERLRIYFIARRQAHLPGKPFRPHTSYGDILQLYECDRQLRSTCFDACGIFEVAFRNSMSEALTSIHGSHPHKQADAFHNTSSRREAVSQLATVYAKSKDARARHYMQTYGDPVLPPFWTIKEFLTFGASVRFYKLLANPMKATIAAAFGLPSHDVFTNWLECLVDLRNVCAHHDRLFNRTLQKQPARLRRHNLPVAPSNKLKSLLECLDFMLAQRGLPAGTVNKVSQILRDHSAVHGAEVGY